MIALTRAYEVPSRRDGLRVLVERLWPRGLSKQRADLDLWLKDVAPSTKLRQWFAHDPAKWPAFEKRYWKELRGKKIFVGLSRQIARGGRVTLVYAAHDEKHNSAVALKEFIQHRVN